MSIAVINEVHIVVDKLTTKILTLLNPFLIKNLKSVAPSIKETIIENIIIGLHKKCFLFV